MITKNDWIVQSSDVLLILEVGALENRMGVVTRLDVANGHEIKQAGGLVYK
jgi:hypothetical protein